MQNKDIQLFEEMLYLEHSQRQTETIAHFIAANPEKLSAFMKLFLEKDGRIRQRGAWVIAKLQDIRPELFESWYEPLVNLLYQKGNHDATDRNISRLFTCTIPSGAEFEGILLEKCYNMLVDPEVFVATKCNAMCIALHYGKDHPELLRELKYIIERDMPHESAAYKNRGTKIIKELEAFGIS